MKDVFLTVKESLTGLFKSLLPGFDVFCEEVAMTADGTEEEEGVADYVFLSITPVVNETLGPYLTARRILVDATVHTRAEDNAGYFSLAAQIDDKVRPVFRFGGRAVTVPETEYRVVDRVLHCVFTLAFTDCAQEPEPFPVMEELAIT